MPSPSRHGPGARGLTTCLLSGGIDSAAAGSVAAAAGDKVQAVFVNYGQLAAVHEAKAARALAHHLEVPLDEVAVGGLDAGLGEVPGRNALFVHIALALAAGRPGVIVLGIHAGTGYRDCSPAFVRTVQDSLDFHTDGALRLHVPFLDLNKKQIFDMAVVQGIPLHLTRSCEAATETPCGTCQSCRDRELLGASG